MTALFLTAAYGETVKSGSLQASSDGVNVTIRWVTDDESSVSRFEVQRGSGINGDFTTIGTVAPGNQDHIYEFVDHSAFMRTTTIYQYRIMVYYTNRQDGVPTTPVTVSHTVSGVRRTWGSIKSLFR